MASYEKRGERSWRLQVVVGYDHKGRRLWERETIIIEDDAILKSSKKLKAYLDSELIKFQMKVESASYVSPDKMSFQSFCQEWKDKFVNTNLEYKTRENYLMNLNKRILPRFGNMQLKQIKTMHLINFLHNLTKLDDSSAKVGSATQVYVYRILKSIFDKAVAWRVISDNPMEGVTKPKEVKQFKLSVYNEAETVQLFNKLQSEPSLFKTLITLALTTGMRRGELLGLEWKHINIEGRFLQIVQSIPAFDNGIPVIKLPKTKGSIRKVSLPESIVNELEVYKKEWNKFRMQNINKWSKGAEFLFCNKYGIPLYPKTLTEKWRDFHSRHPDIKFIRFHDLRHTSATLLINQGVHAKIISERLGHSKISTTMDVYGHVIESADQKAASLFDDILSVNK